MALRFAGLFAAALLLAQAAEPIRLHPENPHYLLFRGHATALITSAEHYGAVLNSAFDYRRYLSALAGGGMNYTRLFGGSYVEVRSKSFGIRRNNLAPAPGMYVAPWARSQTPGYEGGGNKFDLDRWNPDFFSRYHEYLGEASRHGIVVEVTLFSSHYQEMMWKISPLNPANNINETAAIDWKKPHTLDNGNILSDQEKYTRKLIREANEFDNVIFEIQNEPWSDRTLLAGVINPYLQGPARDRYPNSIDVADELSMAWQAKVAEWITSEESNLPNKHLVAQNICNFQFPVDTYSQKASILNFHYAYPDAVTENYGLGKALIYDETGFLGQSDDAYRRQAWNFMLSGGTGFNNLDSSFTAGHEDGSDTEPNGPGGGSPALRRQLRVLSDFLSSFNLAKLSPDSSVVRHAGGVFAHVLSAPGREYAIYLDGNGPSSLILSLPRGEYSAEWINTKTGEIQKSEKLAGGETAVQSPEFTNGSALRIRSR